MTKPKAAFYWCASCGGCDEAVVDLDEQVLPVVAAVDIVFWPVALDFKRQDVENLNDGEMAVTFINGAVRSSEQHEMVELLRSKSQLVIAFGSCAQLGGIPGLANQWDGQALKDEAYIRVPSVINPEKVLPQESTDVMEGELELPSLWNTVKTLDQAIEVDYYLPGCPPPVKLIHEAIQAILNGKLPERGAVLAPDIALCSECALRDSKPEKPTLTGLVRPHMTMIKPDDCLLAQNLLCLGPVTRAGCDAACVKAGMPCTGCLGPTSQVQDFGAKALSAIASLADTDDEQSVARIVSQLVDPVGTFYRYSLPASLLHRSVRAETARERSHD